ncbi:MAG: accessory factor UbiK family protein [Gammaproteobacteria bacterium]|nr:accessory factor UbiK family protein [Gammaproteobacteria bacterium]
MVKPNFLNELADKLSQLIPPQLANLTNAPNLEAAKAEIERNVRSLLQASFQKLDLVTREEFDIQRQVLEKTRAELNKLEARIAELENQR